MSYIKTLKIGSVICQNNLILAPMAGITDSPFRLLCLKGGAGLVCAEMVSSSALKFDNEKSKKMLQILPKEHPLSMQVFGGDPETIALACKLAEKFGADIIDINAGCPVKKVNKAGAGCILLNDLKLLENIVISAVKSVKVPITLKTRIGLREDKILTKEIVSLAINSGASALILHGRVASKMHSGSVNFEELTKAVNYANNQIPLIVNGGVISPETAKQLFMTGAQGVMIGRGAIGNPFLFSQIKDYLETGEYKSPTAKEKLKMYKYLVKENISFYGNKTGLNRSKKTAGFWINNFDGAAKMRTAFVTCQDADEALKILSIN